MNNTNDFLPRISVVVCTCGRDVFLTEALLSLTGQSLPEEQYEIIVVENGPVGKAKEIVQDFQKKSVHITYLYEPLQGLSRAKNAGVKKASGKYLAFMDDDAIADKLWLANILKAFETHANAGAVGGKIEPIWGGTRASWITDDLLKYLSVLDYGDEPASLDRARLFGGNMAFVKESLEQIGGFLPNLGRKGDNLLSGEEAFAQTQLKQQGYDIIYAPDIRIQHHIPAERLCRDWFEKRAVWEGISNAVMDSKQNSIRKGWIVLCEAMSFIRKPKQLFAIVFNLKKDSFFPSRIEAKIKLSRITNLFKKLPPS
ncbi:MAG TPA: glycosyltransferase [Candidatus Omnitrophota bacterium]|nr:glycosyltransferase [Candidatus Omnitrophota bacterium]